MRSPSSVCRPQGQDRAAFGRDLFAITPDGFRSPKSGGVMRISGLAGGSAGVREAGSGWRRRACQ